ncbi:MAG: hypothetical protein GY820_17390, partial [Gammaproteobacteria bacterium]|nr:hypothetical protein [Gammaproteobacteria bacterium]
MLIPQPTKAKTKRKNDEHETPGRLLLGNSESHESKTTPIYAKSGPQRLFHANFEQKRLKNKKPHSFKPILARGDFIFAIMHDNPRNLMLEMEKIQKPHSF